MQSDSAVRPAGGEVQLSAYVQRVARRWYVVLLAIAVAVLLVVLHNLGQGSVARATASIYLGQPTGVTGGIEPNPRANLGTATTFLTSDSTLRQAAGAAGLSETQLHGRVSVKSTSSESTPARTTAGTPQIVQVTVTGPWSGRVASRAANALGRELIGYTNAFQATKIDFLRGKIQNEKRLLGRYQQVAAGAQRSIDALAHSQLTGVDKILAVSPYQDIVFNANTRIDTISTDLAEDRLALAATRNLESSAFVATAQTHRSGRANHRSLYVIAAMAGLIVGVALALAWDALRTRTPVTA
jgi:hypothetical protein